MARLPAVPDWTQIADPDLMILYIAEHNDNIANIAPFHLIP